jgi:hypothetical protein
MPIPQVTDRLKEAPAHALRAIFAGIGQVLLAADKVRNKVEEQLAQQRSSRPAAQAAPPRSNAQPPSPPAAPPRAGSASDPRGQAARDGAAGTAPAAPPQAAPPAPPPAAAPPAEPAAGTPAAGSGARAAAAKPAAKAPAAGRPAAARPASRKPTTKKPATPAGPATRKPGGPAKPAAKRSAQASRTKPADQGAAPLDNYDELTVASLRARMRGLDAAGLRRLIAYERANAGRGEVIGMFERRLTKISGDAG